MTLIAHWSGEFLKYQEWIFASIGANAVLIFVIPSSPMAQPRAIILGNIISALVGVSCVLLIGNFQVAFCLSIAISVFLMICFNCLNAPAAATALGIVIGHVSPYRYVLFPVLMDLGILPHRDHRFWNCPEIGHDRPECAVTMSQNSWSR